jgi:hypothetical protein
VREKKNDDDNLQFLLFFGGEILGDKIKGEF